ncbi:MAG: cation:proton antiporter subunit C [Clostridia bacterium]|nr:cation:proton antiporter subunit C [Clostridia bacterium]
MKALLDNYEEAVAVILFGIGFVTLLFHQNLIKKIIGMNIMDTGLYLFLASMGYVEGGSAPIYTENADFYINPIPAGLVLTGTVVSVSETASTLSLAGRHYKRYQTLHPAELYQRQGQRTVRG